MVTIVVGDVDLLWRMAHGDMLELRDLRLWIRVVGLSLLEARIELNLMDTDLARSVRLCRHHMVHKSLYIHVGFRGVETAH